MMLAVGGNDTLDPLDLEKIMTRCHSHHRPPWLAIALVGVFLIGVPHLGWAGLFAEEEPITPGSDRHLVLEQIEVMGNSRTSDQTVQRQLGLKPGQRIDQDQINRAVASLRGRRLFQSVEYFTKPGGQRGSLILVVIVQESSSQLRLGTGQTDLDGWYLIPLELSLDNLLGRAEESRLQVRFGYRHAGLLAHYGEGNAPADRWHWSLDASTVTTSRVYFSEDVEYAHEVQRGSLGLTVGRRLGRSWSLDLRLQAESAEADSLGEVWQDNNEAGVSRGDDVVFGDLPAEIAAAVGRRERSVLGADLILDTREGRRAGSAASGLWGRLRFNRTKEKKGGSFESLSLDLRGYQPAPGGVLALRLGVGTTGTEAPFYDRLYLGGLYTLRGVPSQSLTLPGGGTWRWHSSLEYRAALIGAASKPRLAGSLFVDAGQAGLKGQPAAMDQTATSLGWGVRYRLSRWLWLGGDFAVPLNLNPANEAFHGHAALGWSF